MFGRCKDNDKDREKYIDDFMTNAGQAIADLQRRVELLAGILQTSQEFDAEVVGRISSINDHMQRFSDNIYVLKDRLETLECTVRNLNKPRPK